MDATFLSSFIDGYVECAMWADGPTEQDTDEKFSVAKLAREAYDSMVADCQAFIEAEAEDLRGLDPEQAGHDFWLTRNHHGAGFWDRGLGQRGDRLTKAAHVYGGSDLYVGDDGKVYVS